MADSCCCCVQTGQLALADITAALLLLLLLQLQLNCCHWHHHAAVCASVPQVKVAEPLHRRAVSARARGMLLLKHLVPDGGHLRAGFYELPVLDGELVILALHFRLLLRGSKQLRLKLLQDTKQQRQNSFKLGTSCLPLTTMRCSSGCTLEPSRSTCSSSSSRSIRCCSMPTVCSCFSWSILYLCSRFTHALGGMSCTRLFFSSVSS
ncbi:hypothetical protein COO60DRAFT_689436 [Scenedesmus sp. NREL 46B-D3]|nr:hypothetical protein COO60DRAFT_689436 [Scenedesmus sp. NREL 46B-D3]